MRRLAERTDLLENDRTEATRAAVAYERARIARELHDLVAHSMAVIVLQSQAAERVLDGDPAATRRALGAIEKTGRQGLVELRRMLDVLLVEEAESVDPRPGLDQLEELADRVRHAGLTVRVAVHGDARPLEPGMDLSAYRIVQEALTNVLKHAGRAATAVDVTYHRGSVELCVTDDGAATMSAPSGQGRGLIGMRERALLFGGSLEAGPAPTGGFRVRAVLPTVAS